MRPANSSQWTHDLSCLLMEVIPDSDNHIRRDGKSSTDCTSAPSLRFVVSMMQKDMSRQLEILRSQEDAPETYLPIRQPRHSNLSPDVGPVSPRQTVREDPRRPSQLTVPQPNFFRPPPPVHPAISPRRYGSMGNGHYSPGPLRHQAPPPPPPPQLIVLVHTDPPRNSKLSNQMFSKFRTKAASKYTVSIF